MNIFDEALACGLILRAAGAVRMVPVHQRIIKTDTHALSSSGIQIFTNEIAARSLLWRTILCGSGVEVTKAFMVLRGHDHVTHAGFPRKLGPIARRKRLRLELLGQGSVFRNRDAFILHDPFVPPENAVESPMNEHPETGLVPPLHPADAILFGMFIHRSEEHTSELQSRLHLVCRLLLEKKKIMNSFQIWMPIRHPSR